MSRLLSRSFLLPAQCELTILRRVSLYLDPQIRDWVLFPITVVMVRLPISPFLCVHSEGQSRSLWAFCGTT